MSKSVLITGGSRGIGARTAVCFAERGYRVAIGYHRSAYAAKALQKSLAERGFEVIALPGDVSNPVQAESLVKQAVYSFGKLDVLVNNAGIAQQKLITDITDEDWQNMLQTNLSGVFYCCRAAAACMVREKSGSIVNISSMWGITGASCEVHYSAAKAGVIGLTKALAKELGPSNIRVNCVAPGVIDTEMNAGLDLSTLAALAEDTPLCRIGTPDEVARAVFYLADEADFITGQVLSPNGGLVI